MLSSLFKWLRPRDVEHAALLKQRFALAYAIIGWHTFAYAFYIYVLKDDLPSEPDKRRDTIMSKMIPKGKNVEIVQIRGMELERTKFENQSDVVSEDK